MKEHGNTIGLYIHVPYCRVLCPYCDYVKKRCAGDPPAAFADALCAEIKNYEGPGTGGSIFFGGGTPSLLKPEALGAIFEALHQRFSLVDPEIGIEANPDDVNGERLAAWKSLGVNRVSLGVQSFDDETLRYLGRCHDSAQARSACEQVAEQFDDWGMDLIFGAQPADSWGETLDECLGFGPPHVSAYGLTFEERTPFWKRRGEAVDEDLSLELYRTAMARLAEYDHYEISNFARAGHQSRHNAIYWRNGEYAGFGPGAYSYLGGIRSRNAASVRSYIAAPGQKAEALHLSDLEIRQETLIQHFRTRTGLDKQSYVERFGSLVRADFGAQLDALIQRGLLEEDAHSICPTQKGYELNNEIGLALVS